MFFEDEKENIDNLEGLDDLDLDLEEDADDESISWDELLKDSSADLDIVSITPEKETKTKSVSTKTTAKNSKKAEQKKQKQEAKPVLQEDSEHEIQSEPEDLPQKKDAFEVFGGNDADENLEDADNIMDDESQSILQELDEMDASPDLDIENDNSSIVVKSEDRQPSIPVIAGVIVAAALVLGSIIFMFAGPKNTQVANNMLNNQINNPPAQVEQQQDSPEESKATEEEIPVVDDSDAKKMKAEKKIVLSVDSAGRANPFLPTFDDFNNNYYAGIPPQSLLPPDKYGNEPDAQDLLRVAVSGILFDNIKPSAIITINGIDYFVQRGDMVDDYLVMDINRQFVVIKKGTNIYKAGVGERFSQNPEINGAAVYGAGGTRKYTLAGDYTSASDVEIHPLEEN